MAGVMAQEELDRVVADLADFFGQLDDSGDGVFGEYARVDVVDGVLTVRHEDADRGVRITVEAL